MSKKRKAQVVEAVEAVEAVEVFEVLAVEVGPVLEVLEAEVEVEPAEAVTVPVRVTKRSAMLTSTVLVATDKVPKNRAAHISNAWAVTVAMLPATAAACIAEIDKLGQNPNGTNASYLTYWQQRGFLTTE
jgi:hypothetical protein